MCPIPHGLVASSILGLPSSTEINYANYCSAIESLLGDSDFPDTRRLELVAPKADEKGLKIISESS